MGTSVRPCRRARAAVVVSRPDSHELIQSSAAVVSRPDSHETIQPFTYIDAAERADRISSAPGRDVVLLSGDDHTTFQPVDTSTPVASTDSNLDWPQVGIGFGSESLWFSA